MCTKLPKEKEDSLWHKIVSLHNPQLDGFGKTLAIQEHGMFDMMDRSSNTHSSSLHSGNAGCWGGLRTARSTWPVASRIQAEGMKGHGLARGSDARQQVSGIWFAVEGDKPWRSATCISARPEQEVIAAVLSPNIDKKCGCPAGHCQCSGEARGWPRPSFHGPKEFKKSTTGRMQ